MEEAASVILAASFVLVKGDIYMDKLGFGMMRLPCTNRNDHGSLDNAQICDLVDTFLKNGFTYFDTAWMYHDGKSEACVGETVVKRHDRDSFTVTDKLPDYILHSEADRDAVFFEQLKRTGAEYYDYYLLHAIDDKNINTFEKFHCFEWLFEKKVQGLIKHCAFSFHGSSELLDRILGQYSQIEFVQLQINYLDWEDPRIQARACYETCVKYNKQVIVMEPVKGGKLAKIPAPAVKILNSIRPDLSPAGWAISFAAGLKNVYMVLSGMSTAEQVAENCRTMRSLRPLNAAELNALEKVVAIIHEYKHIACTGCAYCMAKCPLGIQIPGIFSIYNEDNSADSSKEKEENIAQYRELVQKADPAVCLKCGECESICPQHLSIRDYIETVTSHFEERI